MICRTCAAVRSGSSRLSASARHSTRAGVNGADCRGRGHNPSNPPARYARIQSSNVERPTTISRPSGPTWSLAASARTSLPRSAFDNDGSAASRINA